MGTMRPQIPIISTVPKKIAKNRLLMFILSFFSFFFRLNQCAEIIRTTNLSEPKNSHGVDWAELLMHCQAVLHDLFW